MKLCSELITQLIAQARADAPNETCGIIGGKNGRARKIYSLKNIDANPLVGYNADPTELLNALRDIEALNCEHIGIYHSHPASPAFPSETDIARAFYPAAVHILISLMNPDQAVVRGFRIGKGKVSEITLEVEEKDDEPSRTNSRRHSQRAGGPRAGRVVATLSRRRPARGSTRGARR